MKTITNLKTTVKDGKVTITGDLVEKEFRFPAQQVTVAFSADNNRAWIRHAQMSQEALFVKRLGAGCAFPLEELVLNVASVIEPKLSFPPLLTKSGPLTVEFVSELQPSLQWQESESPNGPFTNIVGQTSAALDKSKVKTGQFVQCVATSEAGIAVTPVVQV